MTVDVHWTKIISPSTGKMALRFTMHLSVESKELQTVELLPLECPISQNRSIDSGLQPTCLLHIQRYPPSHFGLVSSQAGDDSVSL